MIETNAREWLRREQMMRMGTNAPAIGCGGGRQFSSVSFAGFAAPLGIAGCLRRAGPILRADVQT
jgi:hypothetical protein